MALVVYGLGIALLLGSLAKVYVLHSSFFDLGIFESLLFRIDVADELQRAFSGHAHVFALPFGWLYGLLPYGEAPYLLVGVQALLLLAPAIWFYRRVGTIIAFVYLAYYPLWANALFDFHFDHLAVPLLAGFYFALIDRRIAWAALCAILLMLVKEPFALETAACGVLLSWLGMKGKAMNGDSLAYSERRWLMAGGAGLVAVGLVYFYFVMHYLIPFFTPDGGRGFLDSDAFGWLGHSIGEMASNIVLQPHLILNEIFTTPSKLVYLVVVFGLLAFIPLLRPALLIPAIPLLAISMLSRLTNYYDYNTHYTAGLIIPVMFAFVYGLPRAERIWERALTWVGLRWRLEDGGRKSDINLVLQLNGNYAPSPRPSPVEGEEVKQRGLFGRSGIGFSTVGGRMRLFYVLLFGWVLFGHIMLSPSPISRLFWSSKVWSYSWHAYVPTEREAIMKVAMEKYIPADPEVSVTTQNTVNWGHLAHRKVYLPFPLGVAEPHKAMDWSNRTWEGFWEFVRTGHKPPAITHDRYAVYVVLDLKRPYFLMDRGCEWIYGECRDKEMEKKFLDWVAYTRSIYDTVFEQDGFMILRRRGI